MFPRARRHHLFVEEIDRELLVYDEERHRTHRLNESAALVWRLCDGDRSVDEITRMVAATLAAPVAREVVWLVLARLEEAHLLEQALLRPATIGAISRRQALAMGLVGAAALLVEGCGVDTVTAPGGAAAPAKATQSSSSPVSPLADPSPGPSPMPSLEPSPSPPPTTCDGKHPTNQKITKTTCVQKKSNANAEAQTAENQTKGEAKDDAQAFADGECAKFSSSCGGGKKGSCVRKGVGYELRFDGCKPDAAVTKCPNPGGLPPRDLDPDKERGYTCEWTVVSVECKCA